MIRRRPWWSLRYALIRGAIAAAIVAPFLWAANVLGRSI